MNEQFAAVGNTTGNWVKFLYGTHKPDYFKNYVTAPILYSQLISHFYLILESLGIDISLGFTGLSPEIVVAQRNEPLLLNCSGFSASEFGALHIFWKHNGVDITDERVRPDGNLYIKKFFAPKKKKNSSSSVQHKKSDEGVYTCLLRNNVGTLSSQPINVSVSKMSPTFKIEPESQTVSVGENVRFSCYVVSFPKAKYTWFVNDTELPLSSRMYSLLPSGILQIYNVSEEDAGFYKCVANNGYLKPLSSNGANLTVKEAPEKAYNSLQFLNPPINTTRKTKEEVIFECILTYGEQRPNIVWYRESGKPLVKERSKVFNESNLLITNIIAEDGDVYICNATLNEVTHSQRNILTVLTPPTFIKKPENIVKPNSQTARFECFASGSPAPIVKWMKNGEPLVINARIKMKSENNLLVILQTVLSDSGVYQCIAENEAGVSIASARLLVNSSNNRPKPPFNLKAVTLSSTAIELTWQAGYSPNGLIIHAFTVHYYPTNGGDELQKVGVNTSAIIDKLKPYTNYTFYTRAYNERSASEQSESITQMTGEDTPIAVPTVVCTPTRSTSLLVAWNLLPPEKARGKIVSSAVHYRKRGQASSRVRDVPNGDTTQITLNNLEPGEQYEVRVISATLAGYPKFVDDSDWPWTGVLMPLDDTNSFRMPLILHLIAINSTTIEVSWSFPRNFNSSEARIDGFVLSLRQHNKPVNEPVILKANTYQYLLTDLKPETWYEVHLFAFNENETGQESVQSIITLPQHLKRSNDNVGMPENYADIQPPLEMDAYPLSSTSIKFMWRNVPLSVNTAMYTVRYKRASVRISSKNESSDFFEIRSTKNYVVVTDLRPYTMYEFSVSSHDVNNNQGPFSAKIVCLTLEDVPTEPRDLSGVIVDDNTVRLMWKPPQEANGVITDYQILYSTRPDKQLEKWSLNGEKNLQLSALVYNLSSNTQYSFCIRALTKAGYGPLSSLLTIFTPKPRTKHHSKPGNNQGLVNQLTPSMQYIGVIIGLVIGLSFVAICFIVVFWRNRLLSSSNRNGSLRTSARHQNGQASSMFSDAFTKIDRNVSEEGKEMASFTSLLNDGFLDTKGGYTGIKFNGQANVPNGAHRYRDSSQTSSLPLLNNHNSNGFYIREDYRTVPLSSRLHQTHVNKDKPCDTSTCENNAPGRPFR